MMSERFDERVVEHTITPEYMRQLIGSSSNKESLELVGEAIKWFERNYNAVAEAQTKTAYGDLDAIQLRAIPSIDADRREISRGLKDVHHYLQENYVDD